jgi:predicted DNA-binding antitoxin AbrB/MazE fold protein
MTIDVDAVYEDGVLKPDRPLQLEEKARVHVIIEVKAEAAPAAADDDPTGWKAIDRLMGIGKAVASDVAEKHDDYLYGDPHD